ncbi:carboxymuconolactone decarboxylase family protein [Nocardioides humi]|uniref:Carboxymuconolactone decarboxylase family protein n=1 Tax=Nocardioides humi TaxID=449461 RepID=A0ABN2BKV6_9ACTN|nr:carboxymuconolactone decarboxylase family protein [Nocardioides humi]
MARVADVRSPDDPRSAAWNGLQPAMADAFIALSRTVYESSRLSLRVAEAARIRIADINGCLACRGFRLAADAGELAARVGTGPNGGPPAIDRGPAPDESFYDAVTSWRTSELFSERERLAIEYAERMAETPRETPHDDQWWVRMHNAFDEAEIVDLTYSIATWIAVGRFTHTLGFDGACELPLPVPASS